MKERIIASDEQTADEWQFSLRPRRLAEYIGQDKAKKIYRCLLRRHFPEKKL